MNFLFALFVGNFHMVLHEKFSNHIKISVVKVCCKCTMSDLVFLFLTSFVYE